MNIKIRKNKYERDKLFTPEETKLLLQEIINASNGNPLNRNRAMIGGYLIRPTSLRYAAFAKSTICINCGIEGISLAAERAGNAKSYHFNLYGYDKNGNEVLMTRDHIVPKCMGGKDTIENMQTMCCYCNEEKGGMINE